jgi:hypothetical protein
MASPHLTGSCGCGAVKFEIDEPLLGAAYCHCTRCQRRTGGSSSASALMKSGSLRIVQGEDKIKAWTPEDGWAKHFCGECGSALFGGPTEAEHSIVRMGVIDGDPGVRPLYHQFVAYAAPWEPIPDDGLPRHDEGLRVPDA